MNLKYASEYNEFTMFVSSFSDGSSALVYDKDAEGCLLCKVVSGSGNYEAEFVTPDGNFTVAVNVIREESYPNEFLPEIENYFANKQRIYC